MHVVDVACLGPLASYYAIWVIFQKELVQCRLEVDHAPSALQYVRV